MAKTPEEKKAYLAEYYKKNAEKIKARSNARYHANPQDAIAKQKLNRQKNLEGHKKNNRNWRASNLEKARESGRKWASVNKEYRRAQERARRALKVNSQTIFYTEQDVINTYGSLCHICGVDIDLTANRRVGRKGWELGLHIDHLKPIAQGGADTLDNVRPSHAQCNLRKGAR